MDFKKMFDMPHTSIQEVGLYQQVHQQFITQSKTDILFKRYVAAVLREKDTFRDVIAKIRGYLTDPKVIMPREHREVAIIGQYNQHDVLIWIDAREYQEAFKFQIDIIGDPTDVTELEIKVAQGLENTRLPMIKWWFVGRHGDETRDFYLPPEVTTLRPEFYPDLDNPTKFLADYMASDESILLIAGPPGTGKTTLLRHLISKYKLTAHVVYDEKIMDRDGVFQGFLFGDNPSPVPSLDGDEDLGSGSIMVIEDADTILGSREKEGNKLMSRFLNVSDGLIKLPNKKLIFTTNIIDFGNVDHALIRPGRCYGVMKTRELNLTEAQTAAKVADLPIPLERKEYTLAELFNNGKTATIRQVGFGIRH